MFAFNTQVDPSLNLLAIRTVVTALLTLTHLTGLMYITFCLDILEISFVLNLGILAVATYYVKLAVVPVSQAAVAYTSVGIAFATSNRRLYRDTHTFITRVMYTLLAPTHTDTPQNL